MAFRFITITHTKSHYMRPANFTFLLIFFIIIITACALCLCQHQYFFFRGVCFISACASSNARVKNEFSVCLCACSGFFFFLSLCRSNIFHSYWDKKKVVFHTHRNEMRTIEISNNCTEWMRFSTFSFVFFFFIDENVKFMLRKMHIQNIFHVYSIIIIFPNQKKKKTNEREGGEKKNHQSAGNKNPIYGIVSMERGWIGQQIHK